MEAGGGGSKMSQWEKTLANRPNNLQDPQSRRREQTPTSSHLASTCTAYMCPHTTLNKCLKKPFFFEGKS